MSARRERGQGNPNPTQQNPEVNGMNLSELKEKSISDLNVIARDLNVQNMAEQYFTDRGIQVELVRLDGSIELAPLVGLAERIVDLVQSGETLRANGLVEVAEIARSTARLIVNRASMRTEHTAVNELITDMKGVIRAQAGSRP